MTDLSPELESHSEGSSEEQSHSLRGEVIEAQKIRSDLLKRKLEIAVVLGAIGLGLEKNPEVPHASLVLCCLPFVCAYVDLICAHLSLRMMVIGSYLRAATADHKGGYEEFVSQAREMGPRKINAYALEDWASYLSSIILSIAISAIAVAQAYTAHSIHGWREYVTLASSQWPYLLSTALGFLFTGIVWHTSDQRKKGLIALQQRWREEHRSKKPADKAAVRHR